jgi:tetratricopeptide (TPR) repeat protein
MPRAPGGGGVDLPARKPSGSLADLDLPTPRTGIADLPLPAVGGGRAVVPASLGDLDLPPMRSAAPDRSPALSEPGMPSPNAPAASPAGFGELDLGPPTGPRGSAAAALFGDDALDLGELPGAGNEAPAARGGGADTDASFGDGRGDDLSFDLPSGRVSGVPPAAAGQATPDGRRGAGGTGFGEIDLGGEPDGMEFGDLPQAPEGAALPSPVAPILAADAVGAQRRPAAKEAPSEGAAAKEKPAAKRGRAVAVAAGVLLLVGGGGAALSATPYGLFGVYEIERHLPAAGSPEAVRAAIRGAEALLADDTYAASRAALRKLGDARRQMGLNRALLARSALHEALFQQRYGADVASGTRIAAIFARLDERGETGEGVPLARAADALRRGSVAEARRAAEAARAATPDDAWAAITVGEAALAAGDAEGAAGAFRAAAGKGGGARALWGVARALALGEAPAAEVAAAVDATLEASPLHVSARTARARAALDAGDVDGALRWAREAAGLAPVAVGDAAPARLRGSRAERTEALALLGAADERRGHAAEARESYEAALALTPGHLGALLGAGRVLLAQQRNTEALARFEAALGLGGSAAAAQAPGAGAQVGAAGRSPLQDARLGAARAMLALDRARDAKEHLDALLAERPEDVDVLLALGDAARSLGDDAGAEQHYRDAVRLAPARFDGYIALARLFTRRNRAAEAQATLEEAARRVEETADVRRQLGESELEQNRLDAAIAHFERALALDPDSNGARFGLAVALRRSGRLDAAAAQLDRLAERDASYPGLPLERGIVFEAQGKSERAAQMYEAALADRPDDPDLLLRLGAAQVAAGQLDAAEETLRRVANARPNSAEAEHFMGRVAFARGDLQTAQARFDRAVSLDGTRAEFHLYSAWVALEEGQFGKALERVQAALERDASLGDAYWIRGEVRLRSGAVQDALADMYRALRLKPSRHAAWAGAGEALDQLRRRSEAIVAYTRALEGDERNGLWWYRLGRLRMDDGNASAAREALTRATLLGEALPARPGWLPDAHRILGDARRLGGDRSGAMESYRRYLEIASPSAIDRTDVERNLARLRGD